MNTFTSIRPFLFTSIFASVLACGALGSAGAQTVYTAPPATPTVDTEVNANKKPSHEIQLKIAVDEDQEAADNADDKTHIIEGDDGYGREVVNVGSDSLLPAGEKASQVLAVFGSSTALGDVLEQVVAVFGDARAEGKVGQQVVSVFGNTYVNGTVGDQVVAVFGDLELGPKADVTGDVVVVGGSVKRAPAAITRGNVQTVMSSLRGLRGLRPWVEHCLFFGRPLAFAAGLGWAWWLTFICLGLYALTALMFPRATERCIDTMEAYPGRSALAALLTTVLAPIAIGLLFVTVVGIVAIPFIGIGLWAIGAFGKGAMLAWIGRKIVRGSDGPLGNPAVAVLVGGLVVTLLYVVPFLGFIVYQLLGFMGLGIAIYALIRERQTARSAREEIPPVNPLGTERPGSSPAVDVASAVDVSRTEIGSSAGGPSDPGIATGKENAAGGSGAASLPRANFWIRMAALLIDLILVGIVVKLLPLYWFDGTKSTLMLLAIYGAVMWKLRGTTVGGIICNLQVVRIDGREIDWPTAAVRALGCFLSLVVAFLGFLWILFDGEQQSWHDKIAGTVVVRTTPRPLV